MLKERNETKANAEKFDVLKNRVIQEFKNIILVRLETYFLK